MWEGDYRPDILIGELPALMRDDHLWSTPDDHTTCAQVTKEACQSASHPRQGINRVPHTITRRYYLATERSYGTVPTAVLFMITVNRW